MPHPTQVCVQCYTTLAATKLLSCTVTKPSCARLYHSLVYFVLKKVTSLIFAAANSWVARSTLHIYQCHVIHWKWTGYATQISISTSHNKLTY